MSLMACCPRVSVASFFLHRAPHPHLMLLLPRASRRRQAVVSSPLRLSQPHWRWELVQPLKILPLQSTPPSWLATCARLNLGLAPAVGLERLSTLGLVQTCASGP